MRIPLKKKAILFFLKKDPFKKMIQRVDLSGMNEFYSIRNHVGKKNVLKMRDKLSIYQIRKEDQELSP